MNVMPKSRIVSAYIRALEQGEACAAAAQALGIDIEIVRDVVAQTTADAGEELT